MPHQERTNIAVFIDFDNIEIGVKTTLGEHFDIGTILEALKERGEVVTKIAYADWTRAGEYSRALTQHAIRLVQRNLTPGGDKNGADINLALDALEMAFTHPHINAYVIVGGDSDFLSLVEKLKQYDKKVFVVGGRSFTSVILQRNCHEFIAYENLIRRPSSSRPGRTSGGQPQVQQGTQAFPVAQAIPIVRRALKILADREVSPQTGLLKSTLLQLDSTFSERSYGASSFLDFVEKLSQAGVVLLKHSGRSVMVELNPAYADESSEAPKPRLDGELPAAGEGAENVAAFRPLVEPPAGEAAPAAAAPAAGAEAPSRLGDNADGVRAASQLLTNATTARWPMYLRNVKQIFRAGNLDERRYGFGGLMDLLKACQRDGLVRIERDRRGGLRVFQGPNLTRPANAPQSEPEEANGNVADPSDEPQIELADDVQPMLIGVTDDNEPDVIEIEPVSVVDTTAELLGRAKPRAPRARAGRTGVAAAPAAPAPSRSRSGSGGAKKAAGAKKAGGAKKAAPRSRKPVNKDDENFGNR